MNVQACIVRAASNKTQRISAETQGEGSRMNQVVTWTSV